MKSPVTLIKSVLPYILLVMLAQSNYQVYGFDASDCPVEIQVQRNSEYVTNIGNSLTIYCPVHYCKERPLIQWCKIEAHECVLLDNSKAEWNSTVFILKFFAIHKNDSGMYRCQAVTGNFFSESNEIKVIVEEKSENVITTSSENTTSISEESQEPGKNKILHIIYSSVSVGLCCPFIFICMFSCLRRHHAKQKRTPLTPQRLESLVRSPAAVPSHTAGTTQASDESSLLYCSMASPQQLLYANTIYDNDVPRWNAKRTVPNAPNDPSIPASPESLDVLIYATLDHSASAEKCQRRELSVENEFTEYASINVNK
ncbi:B- and T-lymphocyte attenuator isoform X1 [Anas acuta]|uniref:B- and T-lymphocyte attenuator isoform X1 n=1 Tax=Anas acuta TaxID=28680 RepID=UPI0035C87FF5